ncbi:type II secretion system F family protein [Ramlibacter monticola]|uniref:Type II secretion system F family protein n=1 Tax=Ramlibacter monticola TaxID=1926872 RepID=A0A936Z335_9BURK|nr:type II secretion system F family protein [Ramlibacter monticola]MBL0392996.1 type II secretion system F family protein [Ramlibacter monticola]
MRFQLKARRKGGGIVEAVLEAPTQAEAELMARVQGLRVLSITSQSDWFPAPRTREQAFPLLLFTRELMTLLRAGLPLIDTIETLADKEQQPQHKKVLDGVACALHEGQSFSQALALVPSAFPGLFIALVRSSERTGELEETLSRYIGYHVQVDQVKKKIASAAIYPALLLTVGTAAMLFLLGYVVPRFSVVYEGIGHKLPWLSQVLMLWGKFLAAHQVPLAIGAGAAIALLVISVRHPDVRARMGRVVARMPAVRERVFLYQLARFYRSLGMTLRGGIPILASLDMVQGLLTGDMRERLTQVSARVSEGHPLSRALEEAGLTTVVSLKLLRAGERSGKLGEMLEQAADFYDEEMERWVDWFVKLFEPILMTVIGVLIGIIVMLMYLPIFELASSIE